ncbi:N-6 DNA methylase [Winogradskyella poriferorum]|uniref:N-6 DNA methylase n=1 Tax=Winogradskyella poriferorum TaxID=307627 RepID=UPI003D65F13E
MKGIYLKDSEPVKAIIEKVWQINEVLEKFGVESADKGVILLCLSLFKDDLFEKITLLTDYATLNYEKEKLRFFRDELPENKKELSDYYDPIIKAFKGVFVNASEQQIFQIEHLFEEIENEVLTKHFAEIFDGILFKIENSKGKYGDNFIQPLELTSVICSIADLQEKGKVFNPFAGYASFGVYLDEGKHYYGQELNHKTWALGALRLMAYNRQLNSRFFCEDSISNWPNPSEKFDLILATPPFNMRLNKMYRHSEPNFKTLEQFLIERGLTSLNSTGKLIALLPQGFFFGNENADLRRKLIKMDLVESVISLPTNIFISMAISVSIIVLNKNKHLKGQTVFINAQDCYIQNKRVRTIDAVALLKLTESNNTSNKRAIVDSSELETNKFSLLPNRYIFDPLEVKLEKEESIIKLKYLIKPNPKEKSKPESYGKYVRIRDLSDDIKNLQKSFDDLGEEQVPKHAFVLPSHSLMLASRWSKFKPTFYLSGDDAIFYSPDIQNFTVNVEKVHLEYLLQELTEDYVQAQVNRLSTGTTVPYISRKDILDIKIKYPSIDEQKQIVLKRLALRATTENLLVLEKQEELNKEVANQNIYLRHHIAGSLGQVQKSFQSMVKIIEEQVVNELDGVMDYKTNPKSTLTLRRHMDIIMRDLDSMSRSLNKTSKESDLADFKPSKVDFIKFILDYFAEIKDDKRKDYSVFVLAEEWIKQDMEAHKVKRVFIDTDETFLRKMFDNLIENAEVHGFKKSIYNSHKLEVEVMFSFETNEVQINVCNTAYPLPSNFSLDTYKRKGGTAGESGGDGYGGWLINEIMKKHNGKIFSIDDEFYEEYQGQIINKIIVELIFPINVEFYE